MSTLAENKKIIDNNSDTVEDLNNFFKNKTDTLNIQENYYTVVDVENLSELVVKPIEKFEFHPSILLIKNKVDESIS